MFPSLSAFAVCCVRILSRKSSSRKRMKNDPIISWLRGRRVGQRRQIIESHESMLRARLCKQALWHSIQKNLIKFKSFYVHWNFQLIENGNSWFNVDKYFIHPYIYVNKKKSVICQHTLFSSDWNQINPQNCWLPSDCLTQLNVSVGSHLKQRQRATPGKLITVARCQVGKTILVV